MLKPKKLKIGSNIAIISPSSGCPYLFPETFDLGLRNIEKLGLNIIEMATTRMSPQDLHRNPNIRAKDINEAFANSDIDGIICSIGGDDSIRILEYLDLKTILANPKFIMGFSDATTFLTYLSQQGLVTFYGPSVMAGFAQLNSLPSQFSDHIRHMLFTGYSSYSYSPYPIWVNGYKDWRNKETLGECTDFIANETGWTFIQGSTVEEGRLWGGCIEVLEFLKSTTYYPDPNYWHDKILFFETSEERPSPKQVGYMLRNYGIQGVLNKVRGIIFGRPKDYTLQEQEELRTVILNIIKLEFNSSDIPIVINFDFGHTDPKVILPLGCKVRLNPTTNEIILMETPFSS